MYSLPLWLYCLLNKSANYQKEWGFPGGSDGKESAWNTGDLGPIPGPEDLLEKEMTTHSSILAWRIPRIEESGGLQSTRSLRVGHNLGTERRPFDVKSLFSQSDLMFLNNTEHFK